MPRARPPGPGSPKVRAPGPTPVANLPHQSCKMQCRTYVQVRKWESEAKDNHVRVHERSGRVGSQ